MDETIPDKVTLLRSHDFLAGGLKVTAIFHLRKEHCKMSNLQLLEDQNDCKSNDTFSEGCSRFNVLMRPAFREAAS